MSGPRYAELQVTSHFSFLRGASSCEELFATAAVMGVEALAIVDRNSLAGIVRPTRPPRPRRAPGRRLPTRSQRRHVGAGLYHRSTRLLAAVSAALAWEETRRQGQVRYSLGTISSPMARA